MSKIVKRYPIVSFFVLAYAITWIFWFALVIFASVFSISYDKGFSQLLWLLGAFGPTTAAIILTGMQSGKHGIATLLRRIVQWRVNWRWYLFALFGILALQLASILANMVFGGTPPDLSKAGQLLILLPTFFFYLFLAGPPQEELGWRGYALPRLQEKQSALVASLVLSVLWACWHLPAFLIPGTPYYAQIQQVPFAVTFPLFLAQIVPFTILFTWMYNHTNGSLLLAFFLHAANNAAAMTPTLLGVPDSIRLSIANIIMMWLVAIIIVAVTGSRHLSRHTTAPEQQTVQTVQTLRA